MRGGNIGSGFLAGIERTLRMRGTLVQRMLCAAMMAILSFARLPGGGYCCQGAMFAVLLRQGFCVPAGFAGVMLGFAAQYAAGALAGCWQLPVCTMLWLSTGLWAKPANRMTMAAAVFLIQLTAAAVTGVGNGYEIIVVLLTAGADGLPAGRAGRGNAADLRAGGLRVACGGARAPSGRAGARSRHGAVPDAGACVCRRRGAGDFLRGGHGRCGFADAGQPADGGNVARRRVSGG